MCVCVCVCVCDFVWLIVVFVVVLFSFYATMITFINNINKTCSLVVLFIQPFITVLIIVIVIDVAYLHEMALLLLLCCVTLFAFPSFFTCAGLYSHSFLLHSVVITMVHNTVICI